jgi:uncharacterized membrane protein YsdA (DUF1294 family)
MRRSRYGHYDRHGNYIGFHRRYDDDGTAWVFVMFYTGLREILRVFLLPFTAMFTVLIIIAAPWWAEVYLVCANVLTAYLFYQVRQKPERGAAWIWKLKTHLLTLAGGGVGAEIGKHLVTDRGLRSSFRFSIFVGCVVLIWAVNAQHDHFAPSRGAAVTSQAHVRA